ncbi:MAG TPA: hypothetical protein V6C50_04060 [Crinalium sp.]
MSPDSQQQHDRLTVYKAKKPIALTGLIMGSLHNPSGGVEVRYYPHVVALIDKRG